MKSLHRKSLVYLILIIIAFLGVSYYCYIHHAPLIVWFVPIGLLISALTAWYCHRLMILKEDTPCGGDQK